MVTQSIEQSTIMVNTATANMTIANTTIANTKAAKLFYIIGASGAGKDSLIEYVKNHLTNNASVAFARRFITRPADKGGEGHLCLTRNEFMFRKENSQFAMHWYSHETCYGIGIEINQWLDNGLDVVVNGSRRYLDTAAGLYPNLVPVLIDVDPQILEARLIKRGRESQQQIEQRIIQAIALRDTVEHKQLCSIENNGVLEAAGEKLLKIILDRTV